jgi:hypothetical protein
MSTSHDVAELLDRIVPSGPSSITTGSLVYMPARRATPRSLDSSLPLPSSAVAGPLSSEISSSTTSSAPNAVSLPAAMADQSVPVVAPSSVAEPVSAFDRPSKPFASTAVSPLMTASLNAATAPDLVLHLELGLRRGRDAVQHAVDLEGAAERLEVRGEALLRDFLRRVLRVDRTEAGGGLRDLTGVAVGEGAARAGGVDDVVERQVADEPGLLDELVDHHDVDVVSGVELRLRESDGHCDSPSSVCP